MCSTAMGPPSRRPLPTGATWGTFSQDHQLWSAIRQDSGVCLHRPPAKVSKGACTLSRARRVLAPRDTLHFTNCPTRLGHATHHNEPACVVSASAVICPEPPVPLNGTVDLSGGLTYTRLAVYICDSGFELQGPPVRACLANATWSGNDPNCTGVCIAPFIAQHGICIAQHGMCIAQHGMHITQHGR